MIPNFYIIGSEEKRPSSRRTIFADGSADLTYRQDVDMELSHWIPNRTPAIYKADTSTEICMNFIERESMEEWDLAINNHLDVDGVLSIFTLVHSDFALKNRETIVQAAEMGDFFAWGGKPAQILFQGLTLLMNELHDKKVDIKEIYKKCFGQVFALIEGVQGENPPIKKGIEALLQSVQRIESGEIERKVYHERFVHYHIPRSLSEKNLEKAITIPLFNDLLSDKLWLWPQARNKWDKEKVQFLSVEDKEGWYYDLWYPGYMWAETPNSWRAPGFQFKGSTNGYYYGYEPLNKAVLQLQKMDEGNGMWTIAKELSPFSSIKGRNFPVILSYIDGDQHPVISKIPPTEVAALLASVFQDV
ncbi:hypothetical protein L1765_03230 [Microaerobacter geothermalis]|uniref:DUF6687 family protein n=1 Tax=Microaerobacter geothermalis TaxID=674972 RepID=UPI001F1899A4|nr:DUF6687 family protein [Microaerobacter geothermalis]MCF6093007.1 hypothetical protein [Microaerobacter geothermalis]